MNLETLTNTDAPAVAVDTDQNSHPHGLKFLLQLIHSTTEENKKSHMDQLTIRMNPDVLELLKETSRRTDQPIAQIVRACLFHVLKGDRTGITECDGEPMKESAVE